MTELIFQTFNQSIQTVSPALYQELEARFLRSGITDHPAGAYDTTHPASYSASTGVLLVTGIAQSGQKMSAAMARAAINGLAPVHTAVSANARRLSRTKR